MNILCVIDNLGPGGAQRQLVELGIGIREKGHAVTFLTYSSLPFFEPMLADAGINTFYIDEKNHVKRIIRIRRFIRNGGFDAVISFLEGSCFMSEIAGLPFRKWRLIAGERIADPKIYKSAKLRFYRWFHLLSDYVVANSISNIRIIRDVNPLISEKKCRVIYNILDFRRWKPQQPTSVGKDNKFRIVTAAGHGYRKNLDGLVEALSMLDKTDRERISIEWYGNRISEPYFDNSLPEALEKIKKYSLEDVISFYPANSSIEEKIKNADAVALFSLAEGLPNIICEGMACAKPVICSGVSDIPDLLSYDKNLFFDPTRPEAIKKAILYLVNMSKSRLEEIGNINAGIAREKFDREKNIVEYLKLIEK